MLDKILNTPLMIMRLRQVFTPGIMPKFLFKTHFKPIVPFLYLLQTSKNHKFSNAVRGIDMEH